MQMKCRQCGSDIEYSSEDQEVVCEVCGYTHKLVRSNSLDLSNEIKNANEKRLAGQFDEAIKLYQELIKKDPSNCELRWFLLLSVYGITYVLDKTTLKKIPTCNRTLETSIFDDENYRFIEENASTQELMIYSKEAKLIDKLQKDILISAQNHEKYDIFLCYKKTDDHNNRTLDSQYASIVYSKLTSLGYQVFFADETLKNKIGEEYEPIIYSALRSSKLMLVFGSSKDYMEAPWVKNEWSRFLAFKTTDPSKNIAACITFEDAYDLPVELQPYQALNLKTLDYLESLVRSVNSFFGHKEASVNHPTEKVLNVKEIETAILLNDYDEAIKNLKVLIKDNSENIYLWELMIEATLKGYHRYNREASELLKGVLAKANPLDKERLETKYKFLLVSSGFTPGYKREREGLEGRPAPHRFEMPSLRRREGDKDE